ncbi:FG-GAP repeat domain-containing protein [Actinacidiphila sp. ITFR-21]|uniref:FG-GAP repeat domain-containing protein n=1 Tax=Actinacidiphila sp. ITFR-21 TaxID=3075199 RepID=UPI00288BA613|nr:VCBS repeat-containing protein [Streptomyces sp. ITFR-21]WNI18816.1 VCBS repeat-containing protein [Streptomyces sp. ITFR-21]
MQVPYFEREVLADGLTDGYWIQAVDLNGSGRPGLLTSGLAEGVVRWYENPGWTPHVIARMSQPVAWAAADITGDGTLDLAVCHDYGKSMYAHTPDDGSISWLRNPGPGLLGSPWEVRRIGGLVSAHRLRLGHFTSAERLQLLALPVVGGIGGRAGMEQPAVVTVLNRPDDVLAAPEWEVAAVDDASFRILHDYVPAGTSGSGLERFVVASREGLSSYGWDGGADAWTARRFGGGEDGQQARTGFRGSSSVALGGLPAQGARYAATIEPFHGNTVAVYVESPDAGMWRRTVLDVYGDPNDVGEGPGHHVVAADFDGDGEDEFLVALRGPMPWQGVFYYKAVDVAAGLWTKKRVSQDSAARIAVADFNGDGALDFATTGYYTPGYFLADNPVVAVYRNLGL